VNELRPRNKAAVIALAALAIVFAVNAPSQALVMGTHGFGGGHPGGGVHHGFDGHRFGFVYPYYGYYPYGYDSAPYANQASPSWYYCPSYGADYPNVGSCPEAWVPVPAS
jgi:hypothetical protein